MAIRRKRNRLQGESKIGERMGKWIGKHRMMEFIKWSVDELRHFHYTRQVDFINADQGWCQ